MNHNSDGIVNATLALASGFPAYLAAIDPQTMSLVTAIILPCLFFGIGKGADLLLRWYIETRKK